MAEPLSAQEPAPVLGVSHLSVAYRTSRSRRLAVDDVSLALMPSQILGIVGESGCGKSTLGMTILRLLPPNGRITGGAITLEGHGDLGQLSNEQMRSIRGREIAVIFQDPATSLNPRLPIGTQLLQVQQAHAADLGSGAATAKKLRDNAISKLAEVGLPDPDRTFDRYPHELSGGMRQRVTIAMALLLEPKVIIADEATSALDVTLEAQILELLLRLRETHGTSILFISHDLGVVSRLCDRVAVMYAGRVVEEIPGEAVLAAPRHPYTQALLARRAEPPQPRPAAGRHRRKCPRCSRASRGVQLRTALRLRQTSVHRVGPGPLRGGSGSVRCFAYLPSTSGQWTAMPSVEDWRRRGSRRTSS